MSTISAFSGPVLLGENISGLSMTVRLRSLQLLAGCSWHILIYVRSGSVVVDVTMMLRKLTASRW